MISYLITKAIMQLKKLFVLITTILFVNNSFAGDFYWIGNSGNWTDATHWSNSSGGKSANNVPGKNDNVFFDANSFNSAIPIVTISKNISLTNLTIASSPYSFTLQSSKPVSITIYGSVDIYLVPNNKITGEIHLKGSSTSTQNLNFSWGKWNTDFYFDGKGQYILNGPIQSHKNTLNLVSGELDLNGNDVLFGSFISTSGLKRKIISTNSTMLVYDQWITETNKFEYDFSQTTIYVINNAKTAVNKGGDNYFLQQSKKNTNDKIITSNSISADTASCGNVCDGTLIVNFTTTCPSATVDWLPNPDVIDGDDNGTNPIFTGSDTIFNLCHGSYTAVITDCNEFKTPSTQVTEHLRINPIVETVNATSCNDSCNGSISVSVLPAPYANLSYQWTPGGAGDTTNIYSNLCGGNYSLQILDGFGCDTTFNYNVPSPDAILPNVTTTNINCFGDCNGTATSAPTGGDGSYSYLWMLGGDTTLGITSQCAGSDTLRVTDGTGCSKDTIVTITEPAQITVDTSSINIACSGACSGSITATITGGGTPPYRHIWSHGPVIFGASSTQFSLCAGTYSDTIRDIFGCDTVITFTITEPPAITTTTNITNPSCNSICDGSATTTPIGGIAPYTYLWNDLGAQTTDTVTGLCVGTYFVIITDKNLCTLNDTSIIADPLPINPNPTGTDLSCNSVCNGSAISNPTGGYTPYTYSWNTGPTTQAINSLCAGTYIITVTDSNLCTGIDSIIIIEPTPLVLSMNATDANCNGVCNGTADVDVTGGTAPYSYIWAPGLQNTDSIFGLCSDTFTVTVTDSNGCTDNNNIVVNEPAPILPNLTSTNLSCNGVCNGTATAAPTGGTGPYTYLWDDLSAQTTITASGLCAGTYTVIVTDSKLCTGTEMIIITEPPPMSTTTTGTNLSCNGVCVGVATTAPAGGTAPYTYLWDDPSTQTTSAATALCAGTYFVIITDDSLCILNDTIVITEPAILNANLFSTLISCNSACDGSVTSFPIGGTAPYQYSWAPGLQTTQSINGLCAGTYTVTVTDTNLCTFIDSAIISDPDTLKLTASETSASCGAICNGIAIATPTGGTSPYTYAWSDSSSQTNQTATSLCPGTYGITLTDLAGCTAIDSVTINNVITINISTTVVGISCNGVCDGTATANPIGGFAPYTYLWDDPASQTSQTAVGLCPNTYNVTATDSTGCASFAAIIMPVAPSVLVPNGSKTDVLCFGDCNGTASSAPSGGTPPYSLLWSTGDTISAITNLCAGTYWVTVTDSNNCKETDTLKIAEPDTIIPNPTIVDVDCNGNCNGSISLAPTGGTGVYTYFWLPGGSTASSLTNLCPGIYTVTVTDVNGCSVQEGYNINEPAVLSSSPNGTNITCNGDCDGIARVIVGGGTTPYTYFWSPGGQTTDTISNQCPNTYSVLITDSNGCTTSQNVIITEPAVLNANVSGTAVNCIGSCDGTAISAPIGGTAPYSYLWATGGETTPALSNLCIGSYGLTVTDTNGCTDSSNYVVIDPPVLTLVLDSTAVTCNGNDGTATATAGGGTPPYSYLWMPGGQTTPTATNLSSGLYSITLTDFNGCFLSSTVTINNPVPIDDNETVIDANCGVCDGVIAMAPTGGIPPYTHSWSNGLSTPTITNLCPGFYTDTITDFNGCIQTFTVILSNSSGPSGVTSTINDATCYAACDGSANVIPIGGLSPYTYLWMPGGLTDSTITGQCAGTYALTVTDANLCVFNTNIIIGQADSITENSTFASVSCNSVCDGTASVTPSGGTSPYTFLWSTSSTSSSVSGLCAGPISVTITDFIGCTKVVNLTIPSPVALTLDTSTTNTLCNSSCDGTATAIPGGGTAPYTYQWNDPSFQTTATAIGLCAGTYNVVLTDFNGCSINKSAVVNEPSLIVANEVTGNSTCGACDGTAIVAPTGGTGPYTYLWSNGVTLPNVSALCAGSYSVDITDGNGCVQNSPIAISDNAGPIVTVTSTNATCNGFCDGTATASSSGSPTYLWSPGGQTTSAVTGLCAGNYTVEVTLGGCKTVTPVIITDNLPITTTITKTDATCFGSCDGTALASPSGGVPPYSYNWSTGSTSNAIVALCAGAYTVTITDSASCFIIQNVTINEPSSVSATIVGTDATCNGGCDGNATVTPSGGTAPYTYLWSNGATTPTATALCAGSYSVTITDANGCTGIKNINIGEGILITAGISTTDAACGVCDGTATITPGGGAGGPYAYLWLSGGQTTANISNLCPGIHTVEVTDNVGCMQPFNVLISNTTGPTINTFSDSTSCNTICDGRTWVTISAGDPPYTYQWDDPLLQVNDSANTLCTGLYNVIVQDVNGCVSVDSIRVEEPLTILANLTLTNISCPTICDGTITTAPTNGAGTYTYVWTPSGLTTVTDTALCAGTHIVTITDANGCSVADSITLTDPSSIVVTTSATSTTCNSNCDGTALATVSGGTTPYTYLWDDPSAQTTLLATGLCPGNYNVTVTDNNGCFKIVPVTVPNPPVLSTSSIATAASCNGICDGSIATTPAGGIAPYTYIWSNGQTTQTAINLCAGTYNVIVVDSNNCTTYDTLTVTEPAILSDTTSVAGPSCGLCDGSATANPFGGVGPYSYLWGNGDIVKTTVGLCAGTISLQITDVGTGCIANFNIVVNSATGPTTTLTSTDETCTGLCDGSATVTPAGGNPPYSYLWDDPSAQTTAAATNLCAGFYTVTVTDTLNCVSTDTVTINTSGLNLSVSNIIDETCLGSCDGGATVNTGGGTPAFSYLWNPSSQTTAIATNLCVGNYVATVTDNNSCVDSISATINGPTLLTASVSVNTNISCNSVCDGALIVTALGGNTPYTYLWSDAQTTAIANNLCSGFYTITVTDNNGCTAVDTITLTEPSQILANETLTLPTCMICDGSIVLTPSGGTGPYTFLWTPSGEVTSTITNLCAGAYEVTISDITGCSEIYTFALSNNLAPTLTQSNNNASCNSICDGDATVVASGGTAPYSYLWTLGGQTTATATNLCAGIYTVDVTDSVGCVAVGIDTITEPTPVLSNMASTNINCNGVCDGQASAVPSGGTTPYSYSWSPGGQTIDSISNLCAGTYTVTITDFQGCSLQDSVTITEPSTITATSTSNDVTCSSVCDGSATLTVNGGIGPYTYLWSPDGQTAANPSNLCFGAHTVSITDQNNCIINEIVNIGAVDTVIANAGNDTTICIGPSFTLVGTSTGTIASVEWFELSGMISLGTSNSVVINPSTVGTFCYVFVAYGSCDDYDTICVTTATIPSADAGPDASIFAGNTTPLNATGGSTYLWSPTTGLSDSTVANPIASPLSTTKYYATIISSSGCIEVDSLIITVIPLIDFPDGITPNGDGKNDTWVIDFIQYWPNAVVEIYNRWGEQLFRSDDYQNDWDGTYNGKNLPIGTYYYIIELNEEGRKPYTGPITILR